MRFQIQNKTTDLQNLTLKEDSIEKAVVCMSTHGRVSRGGMVF
jgi:hypothetical protein